MLGGEGERTDLEGFVRRMKVRAAEKRLDSDKAIARAAGVNDFVIHNLNKQGRKSFPYADNAVRIARALGTSVEYLVTGEAVSVESALSPDALEICRSFDGLTRDQMLEIRGVIRAYMDHHLGGEPKPARTG